MQYMALPDGTYADVWLRKNIEEVTETNEDGDEVTSWQADEVYLRTAMSESEVEASFDTLFEEGSTTAEEVSDSDRLSAVEDAIAELAELIASLEE